MSPASLRGLRILGAGAALGVAGRTLFVTVPGQLSLALWVGALLLTVAALGQIWSTRHPRRLGVVGAGLALGTMALLWRDSDTLHALNLGTVFGLLALAAHWESGRRPLRDGVVAQARSVLHLAGQGIFGAGMAAARDIRWAEVRVPGRLGHLRAAGVGLLAAVPVVAVFGGLLMQADPLFDRLLRGLPLPSLGAVLEQAVPVGLLAWLAAGLLRGVARPPARRPTTTLSASVGSVEIAVVLGSVVLLFAGFVGVQTRYLFGGEAALASTGLTYASYARRGFFELLWVGALTLPLVLAADWLLDRSDPRGVRRTRWLTAGLLVLLQAILVSALYRMRLYTDAYGLTELRLYATAFMGWLFLAFGWAGVTVLRGRRHRFATGAVTAAVLVVGALNLANPEGLIAQVNLERAEQGARLDADYLAGLGADALPVLLRRAPSLDVAGRCGLARALEDRRSAGDGTWNIARARAERLTPDVARLVAGCAWVLDPRGPAP